MMILSMPKKEICMDGGKIRAKAKVKAKVKVQETGPVRTNTQSPTNDQTNSKECNLKHKFILFIMLILSKNNR